MIYVCVFAGVVIGFAAGFIVAAILLGSLLAKNDNDQNHYIE